MRGLVVAGFAGVAWMFGSAMAQAASPAVSEGMDLGGVTELLAGEGTGRTGFPMSEPPTVGERSVAALRAVGGTRAVPGSSTVVGGFTGFSRDIRAALPVRKAQPAPVPADERHDSGASTVVRAAADRASGARSTGARTIRKDHRATVASGKKSARAKGDRGSAPASVAGRATVEQPSADVGTAVPAVSRTSVERRPAAGGATARRAADSRPASGPTEGNRSHPTGLTGESLPAPSPAPIPAPAGPVMIGTSTTTSGSSWDGAATAVPTSRFATGAMGRESAVPAADVAARPLTALVPTVSPD
ncbi:hypothetical protein [Virgisporangium aliadipatigenens]|uniref:hypothetical protein n=1 Tax=Virgisporangium aliadipatigenens TaxID=741659 RepID=UPI0019442D5B|nr:hypothetical protein [Virgisporangium aliadipatigenens]